MGGVAGRRAAGELRPYADCFMRDGDGIGYVRVRLPAKQSEFAYELMPKGTLVFILGDQTREGAAKGNRLISPSKLWGTFRTDQITLEELREGLPEGGTDRERLDELMRRGGPMQTRSLDDGGNVVADRGTLHFFPDVRLKGLLRVDDSHLTRLPYRS